MASRRSSLILAVLVLGTLSLARPGSGAEPRWVPLGPPAPLRSARLVVEPGNGNRVYAFSEAGLWLSRDDADSWRSIQTGLGLPPRSVALDPFQPGRIFAVAEQSDSPYALYRSDDFGARWTLVALGNESTLIPQEIVADPFTKDSLFGLLGDSVYRSRDAGRTWSCVSPFGGDCQNGYQAAAVAVSPVLPKTLYILRDTAGDFHVSRDDGRTWTSSELPVPYLDVLVATREPRTLYAWPRGLFYRGNLTACFARSDDEGQTWRGILYDTKCGVPSIDPGDPRTVRMVVAVDDAPQLWVSRNGGDTWSSAGSVPAFGDVYVVPGGGLALATDKGIFRAPADPGPWRPANRGFGAADVGAVLPVGEAVLAAPVVSLTSYLDPPPVSLLRTEDGGRSWKSEPLTNPFALAADPSDPLRLIASAVRFDLGYLQFRILESRDGGHTWRGVVDPEAPRPSYATALAIDPFLPRTFYSNGPSGGVYRSDDGGLTWRDSNLGLRKRCYREGCSWGNVHTILTDPTKAGRMFIHINGSVYRSLDNGISWTQTSGGPLNGAVYEMARDLEGALIVIGDGQQRADDGYILGAAYRSTDHGATWERLGRLPAPARPGLDFGYQVSGIAATEGALWVATRFEGIFRSTDGGRTWKPANQGLPLPSITSLVTDPENPARLYITIPGNGIYTLAAQ